MIDKYCVDIIEVFNTIYTDIGTRVLCQKTSSTLLGMSSGWGLPIQFYYIGNKFDNSISSSYIQGIPVSSLDNIPKCIINGVLTTTQEYTIIDLLINRDSIDNQVIFESIAYYYYKHNECIDILINMAERYGCSSILNEYIEEAIQYYDN